jgi:outer membrane cobalamin receptor
MTNYAAFLHLQNRWLLFPFEFTSKLSLRHDIPKRNDSLDFDDFSSYHLSGKLEYENILQYAAGASWGNSYLLPSFYDLYWKGGLATSGNPELKPEKSQGYQLFSQISHQNSYVKFTYDNKQLDNSIYWYKSLLNWKPGNIGGAEVTSYNVESKIALGSTTELQFSWLRNFAYDRSDNSAYEGNFLTYVPTSLTKLGIKWQQQGAGINLSYQRTGRRWPSRDHLWGHLPAYETVNGSVFYQFQLGKLNFTSKLELNNLMNTKYQKYLLTPEPGFNWNLGLRIEFLEK